MPMLMVAHIRTLLLRSFSPNDGADRERLRLHRPAAVV